MNEEWTDWIEHDGKGCPCIGKYVRVEYEDGVILEAIAGSGPKSLGADPNGEFSSWVWSGICIKIIRYQIRIPKALIELREMVKNVEAEDLEDA